LIYDLLFNELQIVKKSANTVVDVTMLDTDGVANITGTLADLALVQAQIDEDYLVDFDAATAGTPKGILTAKVNVFKDMVEATRNFVVNGVLDNSDVVSKVATLVDKNSDLASIVIQSANYAEGYPGAALTVFTFDGTTPDDFDGEITDLATIPTATTRAQFNYDLFGNVVADAAIYVGADATAKVENAIPYFRELLEQAISIFHEIKTEIERIILLLEEALVAVDPIYANIKKAIAARGMVVPPSGAVAGIYVATDANRGVWKAPANVSLSGVVKPTIKVDNATQELLNVDTTAGKSVNVIRSFTGKGVLVWGARTLAGNDNEWRYVPVRRLFNTIEESVKKATEFVVFEPNDGNTWLRTRTMIENYLTGLWRQGAIAGAKPADAFFVNCGLGTTMTAQDILEGKMIVEIGISAVRPAEFIILRFSHKLQES
jgi:hypothetical protein